MGLFHFTDNNSGMYFMSMDFANMLTHFFFRGQGSSI